MIKTDVQNGINEIIQNFTAGPEDILTATQQTALTDAIAGYLDTVNPTNNQTHPTQ